ncbi:oligopeptide/dipeptide ABC transporter ATP-binding protein [Desulfovibrio sp. 86]|uniref:Oligopeptide transporter subunit ATP-binding component of ABC superfamily n=1 Tax=uncultured Desulfovibrio sp. TaxID=167968 RepID=A0A212LA50_9BACT|nr:oligopeptide transporter subunit; ATP-binding component of ABC superfamily [uncultured Desulfovibrio sp.]VZH34842.1 Oligopeptide transport ATP-binding protein AppF [Desulfovibrio sp. 86]
MLTMTDGARGDLGSPREDGVTTNSVACTTIDPPEGLAADATADSTAGLTADAVTAPTDGSAAVPGAVPLLELREVSRHFAVRRGFFAEQRLLTAVDAVSLRLYPGESLGLVGESGCGKSTLGRLACGLLAPSKGQALLGGRDLPPAGANSWAAGQIQMVFQDPFSSLNPRLSARASIAEPLAARNIPRAERLRLADEMLATVGLEGMGGRYPHEFSGGQRQRIAVARALITRPQVVVCDEPVSALDASVQAQILNLLRDVQEHFGPAYLFISHDLSVVGFLCRRIVVMYLGQVVEEASAEQLFSGAAHPYTQALMAAMPTGEGGGYLAPPLEGELPSPLDPPTGCRFHPRCPKAQDICRREAPAWKERAPDWRARCWFA